MLLIDISRPLLLATLAFSGVAQAWQKSGNSLEGRFVPNKYIVQVNGDAKGLSKRGLTPAKELERVVSRFKAKDATWRVARTFDQKPEAFNGASIVVSEGTTMEDIQAIEGVQSVWPLRLVSYPKPSRVSDDDESEAFGAPVTAEQLLDNPDTRDEDMFDTQSTPTKRSKRQVASPLPSASAYRNDVYGPHVQTGIDKIHARNRIGTGVKVCFLDDGVDYLNPILGGGYGPGFQISGGYDFVGDNYDGTNEPQPDNDPFASCTDHGTFVAGVLAALPNPYGFTGVTPGSTFSAYRISGCTGVTTEDMIIAGMQRASDDGCNVISLSLGMGIGWLEATPSQILLDYLVNVEKRHIFNANGNEGSEGAFFSVAPAASREGSAIGSAENTYLPTYQANVFGKPPIAYMSPKPLQIDGDLLVYFTSLDPSIPNDACTALPADTPDLTGRLVVVQRGTCTYAVKYRNIVAKGGKYVLLYNTDDYMLPQLNVGTSGLLAVAGLTRQAGLLLLDYYNENPRSLRLGFPTGPLAPAGPTALVGTTDTTRGGLVAPSSNWGPTNELFGLPSYIAPGQNILSTVPMEMGGVEIQRGSSWAGPLAAGATALLLSDRAGQTLSPQDVRSLFTTTATFVPTTVNGSTPTSLLQAGGGTMNASSAINARTIISPHSIFLNDTTYFAGTQKMTLRNRNSYAMRYTLGHRVAQTRGVYTNSARSDVLPATTPSVINDRGATVSFGKNEFVVAAGGSTDVEVRFVAPRNTRADLTRFPLYSGHLTVRGRRDIGRAPEENYNVPYSGLNAKMFDMPVLDTTDVVLGPRYPFLAVGEDINVGSGTYARDGSLLIYFRLAAGTRRLSLDLVDANVDFTGTVPAVTNARLRRRQASAADADLSTRSVEHMSRLVARAYSQFDQVPTVGSIFSSTLAARDYRLTFGGPPFSDYELPFDGTFTNADGSRGSAVTGTQYRVLLRVLKITGNAANQDQYESWLSPPFSFTN